MEEDLYDIYNEQQDEKQENHEIDEELEIVVTASAHQP